MSERMKEATRRANEVEHAAQRYAECCVELGRAEEFKRIAHNNLMNRLAELRDYGIAVPPNEGGSDG